MTSTETIALQAMRWWDIAEVAELEGRLFATDSPWTEEMFWAELAQGRHYRVYRDPAGVLLGYAGLSLSDEDAEIQTIGVHPDHRGRGIGWALLSELLGLAGDRGVLLEVRTDNEAALGMYRRAGFEQIGLRRKYYQPSGADAFVMQRPTRVAQDSTRGAR